MTPHRRPPLTDDLTALSALCECVYQPNRNRIRVVMGHDWSGLPRVGSALRELPEVADAMTVSLAARGLIERAVAELADAVPPTERHSITPLDVVRWHVLDGEGWESLEARLREEGRPLSRGTLIRRQKDFLPWLEFWAKQGAEEANPTATDVATPTTEPQREAFSHPGTRRLRRMLLPALGAVAAVLALGWGFGAFTHRPDEGPEIAGLGAPTGQADSTRSVFSIQQRRRTVIGLSGLAQLPPPLPPLPLPSLGPRANCALPIERVAGQPRVLISWSELDDPAARLLLWDPLAQKTVWSLAFVPPDDERETHPGVGPEVRGKSYEFDFLYHGGLEGDLGEYAVAVAIQGYSPTFAAFVNLDDGTVDGYYVHPGYLEAGVVLDVDGDGAMDAVLGGQDNSVDRAVVVALRPGPGRRIASTVQWNPTGQEGALARVLMPRAPELTRAYGARRLTIKDDLASWFDHSLRVLPVGVGLHQQTGFHVQLGPGLVPVTGALDLWDADLVTLERLGVDPDLTATWATDLVYVSGTLGLQYASQDPHQDR